MVTVAKFSSYKEGNLTMTGYNSTAFAISWFLTNLRVGDFRTMVKIFSDK